MGREPILHRISPLTPAPCDAVVLCGISTAFAALSPCKGQVAHALLTRPPLKHLSFSPKTFQSMSPLDLHVLGTPPAFVLSQNQTLLFILLPHPFAFRSASLTFARFCLRFTLPDKLNSYEIDCLFCVYFSFSCIVFKVLALPFCFPASQRRLVILPNSLSSVKLIFLTLHYFFSIFSVFF